MKRDNIDAKVGDFISYGPPHDGVAPCRVYGDEGIHEGLLVSDEVAESSGFQGEHTKVKMEHVSQGLACITKVKKPSMVNSQAYRNNWDGIFGKQTVGEA